MPDDLSDIKVTPEDNPLSGIVVDAKDNPFKGGRKHHYPVKAESQTDEELGLVGAPEEHTFHDSVYMSSPTEKALKGRYEGDIAFLKEAAPFALGGLVGEAGGAALSRLAPTAIKGGEAAGNLAGKAIANTADHALHGGVLGYLAGSAAHHPIIGSLMGVAAKPVLNVAAKLAPEVIAPVVTAGAKAIPTAAAAGTVAASQAPMSNMIDRLRASAVGNPRAAELLRRIDAIKSPNMGAGTEDVTQGTLGNP